MRNVSALRWWNGRSLRTRVLLISATAVAAVLATGGFLLITLVHNELLDGASDLGEDAAEDVVELALEGELPWELPRAGSEPPAIQVVRAGRVISQTPDELGRHVFQQEEVNPGRQRVFDRDQLPIDEDGPFRVVAIGTETPDGPVTVFVAVDVEDVAEAIHVARQIGAYGLIIMILVLCGLLWVIIGRTLAPVAAIRARAEAITASGLDQRVPEHDGGDEISELARTINDMLARLEASAQRQEAFVADAAHELRSPIAGLQARLETTPQAPRSEDDEQLFRDLLRETWRMRRLIDDLLLLARSDAGTIDTTRLPVDVDEVVRETVATIASAVPISTDDVEPVQVHGQSALLEHVVRNLLENAARYATDSVAVSLKADGRNAVLTVDDDGTGIPEVKRDDVLNRFVRLDSSRDRDTGGAGLGLAIVHEIVAIHAGDLAVLESPSGGARLQVTLPLP